MENLPWDNDFSSNLFHFMLPHLWYNHKASEILSAKKYWAIRNYTSDSLHDLVLQARILYATRYSNRCQYIPRHSKVV